MDHYTMRYINTIARCANLYHDEALRSAGLSSYQSSYIPIVCAKPGITQDQIARRLHVHSSSVTRHLSALETAGFVTRRRSSDDRRADEFFPVKIDPLRKNPSHHAEAHKGMIRFPGKRLQEIFSLLLPHGRRLQQNLRVRPRDPLLKIFTDIIHQTVRRKKCHIISSLSAALRR